MHARGVTPRRRFHGGPLLVLATACGGTDPAAATEGLDGAEAPSTAGTATGNSAATSEGSLDAGAQDSSSEAGTTTAAPADVGLDCPPSAPFRGPALTPGRWVDISPPGLHRPYGEAPPFGCMDIHVVPCEPGTLLLTTDSEGMWRSDDGGASWAQIGDLPQPVSPGVLEIDPADTQHLVYVGGVRGASLGFWVSHDRGDHWTTPEGFVAHADNSVGGWTNDVYHVAADPSDFDHLLLTFHSGFEFAADAGVLESTDGGQSWVRHDPEPGWGAGHSIWFVGDDGATWLLGTQGAGYWRTTDGGATWTQVLDVDMQHGGVDAYRAADGTLYVGAVGQILRSEDDGATFELVGPPTSDGYYAVIGDGTTLYAQLANTGGNTTGPQPYVVSPEGDGVTWTEQNDQRFSDGPYRMDFDPVNRIVYSANWNEGVWALAVDG